MKKRLTSALSAVLCVSCLTASMTAYAGEWTTRKDTHVKFVYNADEDRYVEMKVEENCPVLVSDAFTFHPAYGNYLHDVKFHDEEYNKYLHVVAAVVCDEAGVPVEYFLDGPWGGTLSVSDSKLLMDEDLVVGDVVEMHGIVIADIYPAIIDIPASLYMYKEDPEGYGEAPTLKYLGKGTEVFGDDFKYVVCEMSAGPYGAMNSLENRRSWYEQMNWAIDIDYGDANADGKVNIMDVINVNRNLMIGAPLTAYGTLAADVDKNGEVDAVDSLNMLKSIVGLVDLSELG
ncbi:MAG: dockerin type I repeat-containing protein [Oscillospiraceae bacterium]|nr:dockerin type I repeat-containing protein [Oscillospiraceae bacterium]